MIFFHFKFLSNLKGWKGRQFYVRPGAALTLSTPLTVKQERAHGGHVGHCSKMTSLYECFFLIHEQSEVSAFLITPSKISVYTTALSLSVQHI